jgi:HEAT repeat protein
VLLFLIVITCCLAALVLILVLAIIVKRVRYDRDRRHYQSMAQEGEPLFFAYLEGEETEESIASLLETREDYDHFSEFITYYLKHITGEDVNRIAELALATGLTSRLHSDMQGDRGSKRKATAAITLGLMEDGDVLPYLREMLEDDDPYLVYAGAYGIACLREYSLFMLVMHRLLNKTPITYEGTSELLVRFGEDICPTLTDVLNEALLRHERVEDSGQAVDAYDSLRLDLEDFIATSIFADILGYFRYKEATDLLIQVMETADNDEVIIHVLKALVRLEPSGVASRVVPFLTHPNWVIRSQAARVLGVLGEKKYAKELEASLNDEQWWVRHYAAQALQALA